MKLRTVVNSLSLRRPKTTVHLPHRTDEIKVLELEVRERDHYEMVKAQAAQRITTIDSQNNALTFLNALHYVNELRLVCNHGVRRKGDLKQIAVAKSARPTLTAETAQDLFDEMCETGLAVCSDPDCRQDISSTMSSEADMNRMEEPHLADTSELLCSVCFKGRESKFGTFFTVCNHLPRCAFAKADHDMLPWSRTIQERPERLPTKIETLIQDLTEVAVGVKR